MKKQNNKNANITVNVPLLFWNACEGNPMPARMLASKITEEMLFKSLYPKYLRDIAWWWHTTTFWEKVFCITINPICIFIGIASCLFLLWLPITIIIAIIIVIIALT